MGAFSIEPRGPFSWEAAVDVLCHFAPMQRHWAGTSAIVRLAFPLDGAFTPVAVALRFDGHALRGEVSGTDQVDAVSRQVARILSLDLDGSDYPSIGERQPPIGALMRALPGLRPVCFTSPYETAAWAIISGGISRSQAARIQDRLLAEHGHALRVAGEEVLCFPTPDRLLATPSIAGITAEKAERLQLLAQAALEGRLDADRLRGLGDQDGPASVLSLRGIGPFWSQGIYLRGCGIPDVFPDEPLSIAALGHVYGLGDRPDSRDVRRLTESFRPYRMWVCFLLRVAASRGHISGVVGREGRIRRAAQSRRTADRTSEGGSDVQMTRPLVQSLNL